MKTYYRGWSLALMVLPGCQDVIDLDPIDTRPPIEARVRPGPISGGTLTIASDGVAVAADPDRDVVHVVDLAQRSVRHTIALEAGDEPGRVAIGSAGLAHVVLRGFGGVATIDLAAGAVVERRHLCPDPRGIAFDAAEGSLHVACADGTLVATPESGAPTRRQTIAPDARDVIIVGGEVMVSLFREASIVREDGSRLTAQAPGGFEPHVAWHTRADDLGRIVMIHQVEDTESVPINPVIDDFTAEESLPYGGGGNFCEPGIATAAVTIVQQDGEAFTVPLPGAPLTVDAAMSPDGAWVALAQPGVEEGKTSVSVMSPPDGCFPVQEFPDNGQVTAVAYDPGGALVMQSREPARLMIMAEPPFGRVEVIELGGESVYDSGHEIFHRATESGLSCASCHPEGGDDGHVWTFEGLGPRRTQALDIGLADTAPFHWDGDMVDLDMIMDEVLAHRMGGKRQSAPRAESFTRWVFEQERPPADTGLDEPTLVTEGAALFATYDCGRCHTGPMLGGQTTEPVAGKELQVPSLRRVALRPPFMHDGRALTLEDAVADMIATTSTAAPTDENVAALTAYMRTL
jgi:mono/diheme cytochrome c family protein